jgi:hypothetical protein
LISDCQGFLYGLILYRFGAGLWGIEFFRISKDPTPSVLPLKREGEEKLKPCGNLAQVAVN